MTSVALAVWLLSRSPHHDLGGLPIRRRHDTVAAIARAASRRQRPKYWASVLDVWTAYETGYAGPDAAGGCPGVPVGTLCRRDQGAHYCSPWMLLCSRVPVGASLFEMAELALTMFDESRAACPHHPFGRFVGVGCRASRLVDFRLAHVAKELRE